MIIWHNLTWLQENHPEAFNALPEPYQADSCLEFGTDEYGLWCAPIESERAVLGDWECVFEHGQWCRFI